MIPWGRLVFAAVSFLAFLTTAVLTPLAVWLAGLSWMGSSLLVLGVVLALFLAVKHTPVLGAFGALLNLGLRTNNRWLVCMWIMAITSVYLAWGQPPGRSERRTATVRSEIQDKYENLYRTGKYGTPESRPAETPKAAQPQSRSWKPWWIRWLIALGLTIASVIYTPIAFVDELQDSIKATEAFFGRNIEGSFWKVLLLRLIGMGGRTPTPAPPGGAGQTPTTAPAGTSSWWSKFTANFLAEIASRFFGRW